MTTLQYQPNPVAISSSGGSQNLQGDINANLKVTLATLLSGENQTLNRLMIAPSYSFSNITTNTTTVVKGSAGILKGFTINNPGKFTVADLVVTIYDNTAASGTKIGTWTIPVDATQQVVPPIVLDVAFSTGLTIVTSGPTVAADITVSYL